MLVRTESIFFLLEQTLYIKLLVCVNALVLL